MGHQGYMLDFPLISQLKLPVVDGIQPKSNMFAKGAGKQGYW